MLRTLFVFSEIAPYSKTGGLADVGDALPVALGQLGVDTRVLVPYYGCPAMGEMDWRCTVSVPYTDETAELWSLTERPQILFLRYPSYYERDGGPYQNAQGEDWPDNDRRFALLNRVAVEIAQGRVSGLDWRPDIVHANDWQTGLIPYLLDLEARIGAARPPVLFTIHNLAYQGRFPPRAMASLHLPAADFHWLGTEHYGAFSFMKAGLAFSDQITTVSPTYAAEIQTSAFGMGLDGLLRSRSERLSGILNGIDTIHWNPGADPYLAAHYSPQHRLPGKALCKSQLQSSLGLYPEPGVFLLGMISRLVEQKGTDMVLDILPDLLRRGMQVVVLGSGDKSFERQLLEMAAAHPAQMATRIAFDEGLSHRIEAGVDAFLMPSRFEPCGLNQMYSLRYGTIPIVHRTGGLADTVTDADDFRHPLQRNGFVFDSPQSDALHHAVLRAEALFRQPALWSHLQDQAMAGDYSWQHSARAYLQLYYEVLVRHSGGGH
ncbi:MAG: glycogen synthase GlgA [Acidithiobacillus ferrooxidans]